MKGCKNNTCRGCCSSGKDKELIDEIELRASTCPALASFSVQGLERADTLNDPDGETTVSPQRLRNFVETDTCIRIWGDRPFQAAEDNDNAAKTHWKSVCEITRADEELKKTAGLHAPPAERPTRIVNAIQSLNPGHGPGLPSFLPVSINTMSHQTITKCVTGKTFMLFLTGDGGVYSLGVGKHGELGLGDKMTLVRTPVEITFESAAAVNTLGEPIQWHKSPPRDTSSFESQNGFTFTKSLGGTMSPLVDEVKPGVEIVDIACGDQHAMALEKNGRLWIWGSRLYVGMRTCQDLYRPAVLTHDFILVKEDKLTGRDIQQHQVPPAAATIRSIGAGSNLSVTVTTAGRLLMWGILPGGHPARTPELIAIFTKLTPPIRKIVVGLSAGIILTEDGIIHQFGVGTFGEILDKRTTIKVTSRKEEPSAATQDSDSMGPNVITLPMVSRRLTHLVPEHLTGLLDSFGEEVPAVTDVAMGDQHVLLLVKGGLVYSYGDNHWGQCGLGAQKRIVETPTIVNVTHLSGAPLPRVRMISAGGRQSGVVTATNRMYLWGCNADYRLVVDATRELVEFPTRYLHSSESNVLAQTYSGGMGVSTVAGVHNSKFYPQPVAALAPFSITGLTMGWSYTVVITGEARTPEEEVWKKPSPPPSPSKSPVMLAVMSEDNDGVPKPYTTSEPSAELT
eukprot:Blabericola_migrator_1__6701@NODE_338_length_9616_cov_89_769714_g272_i0_p3_GENE_NODE_338_length_9616_cov_89_769714_g272_i0NODE_338_length_9616_cov_89_769714_g272_i0_p3_ORF_typecomplete_len680_score67_67RCC1/PF00415_18/1_2e03RCC1/PF00415_18/1_1e07RCC1/PF00415_18/1_5e03RCC1/PF00415_18/7_4e03RCC1/PF00415_18/3_9RCC1/PF00415_18/1_3e05RCC1/PF00415_18/1_1RCC1_2/PF13540_6/2_1e02RCC1_2/PF13540_6/5_3e06RCC1_2/PF13540_6/3_1RCC1_2/PF13540_6/3_1e03RCC1_2/PF13540_6/0_004RCC1_2/PF13540_6/2_1RCC1_2/PF13540_6/8_